MYRRELREPTADPIAPQDDVLAATVGYQFPELGRGPAWPADDGLEDRPLMFTELAGPADRVGGLVRGFGIVFPGARSVGQESARSATSSRSSDVEPIERELFASRRAHHGIFMIADSTHQDSTCRPSPALYRTR